MVTITEAKEVLLETASKVNLKPLRRRISTVGGIDVAYRGKKGVCAVVVMRYCTDEIIEERVYKETIDTPYIPGYLFLREGHIMQKTLEGLKTRPDVLLVDGQGIAHPAGAGIASYIGVTTGIPTIGCAKSKLLGTYREPSSKRGSVSLLQHEGRVIGAVVRTRDSVRPVFVSPGHLLTLEEAVEVVLHVARGYRIPEPLRRADILSRHHSKREG